MTILACLPFQFNRTSYFKNEKKKLLNYTNFILYTIWRVEFCTATMTTTLAILVSQIDNTVLRLTSTFQLILTVLAMKFTSLTLEFEGMDIWASLGHPSER